MNPHYIEVAHRAGHRCEYCRAPEVIFNGAFEVEHVFPRSREGGGTQENLALACRRCNLWKSDRIEAPDPVSGQTCSLFHARNDVWTEHFKINSEDWTLIGVTATERATVDALK
jgi:HNH endonuclease